MRHTRGLNLTRAGAILAIVSAVLIAGCDNKALLTEMASNRLVVIIKGTYESNGPQEWNVPLNGAVRNPDDALVQDGSVNRCMMTGTDTYPSVFMLDLAEMRLVDGSNWKKDYKFSQDRQTLAFGLNDLDPFFSGMGVLLNNDDVPAKYYPFVTLYVRKMLLDGARRYEPTGDGWISTPVWDVYDEKQLPSFNFNRFQVHAHWDMLRLESAYINRVFPIVIPIGESLKGMIFNKDFPYTVLEIRIVVKNFIKKYEFYSYNSNRYSVTHYYGFSDWLQDVQEDESDIGGNLLAVARMYVPGLTGRISGSNGAGNDAHVIAVPHSDDPNNIYRYTREVANPRDHDCNLPNLPGYYIGNSVEDALDRALKMEQYKIAWNDKVPGSCTDYNDYCAKWNAYVGSVSDVEIPELATFALSGGQYSIENVPPGRYDVYRSTQPEYGKLYTDGAFTQCGTVTVGTGATAVVNCP